MANPQLENRQQLKALIKANNVVEALHLFSAVDKWPKIALDEALSALACQVTVRKAAWTTQNQALATALLDAGAKPDVRYCGRTPLHCAAEKHNLAFVALLLERGARVNAKTTYDLRITSLYATLHKAYDEGEHLPIVVALLEAGADPKLSPSDPSKPLILNTPLELALEVGALETAKLLVAHGARVNHRRSNGRRIPSKTHPICVAS